MKKKLIAKSCLIIILPVAMMLAGIGHVEAKSYPKNQKKHAAYAKSKKQVLALKTKRNKSYYKSRNYNRYRQPVRARFAPLPQISNQSPIQSDQAQNINANEIVSIINEYRQNNGLGGMAMNSSLNLAAANKAQDMLNQNYFAHTNPQSKNDFSFMDEAGYRYQAIGSNLASGDFQNSRDLVDSWMNSPGHRANILASFGQEIGISLSGNYYVMFIANPL